MTPPGPLGDRPRPPTRTLVAVALAGVLTAIGIAVVVLIAAGSGGVETHLGTDRFSAGRTDSLANAIEREGPILFPDLLGRDRPLYIHHVGDDLDEGWLAIGAVAPGQSDDCILRWTSDEFEDPCSAATYTVDDDELIRHPTVVEDERVYVDLRDERDE